MEQFHILVAGVAHD